MNRVSATYKTATTKAGTTDKRSLNEDLGGNCSLAEDPKLKGPSGVRLAQKLLNSEGQQNMDEINSQIQEFEAKIQLLKMKKQILLSEKIPIQPERRGRTKIQPYIDSL
mmetsp:Transcript_14189/g.22108  ORF Transcript_14189/g.22108 Transcript_14189/m.22108 type:complete len:109 (+) Transcript_14189:317-643(+)